MFSKKYSQLLFVLIVGFFTSLLMTLIITYINTGFDKYYIDRFLTAWVVSLPIAIGTVLLISPIIKNFVNKITKLKGVIMSELIAFIGVGNMGNPMAENLMKAGKKIKVFDASKEMIKKAKERDLDVTESIDALITSEVTTVITMLPEGKNSKEVYL